ncbi:MAG: NAD(P)H-hydrate epimerase [Planctomycetota bacterium]|nr:MAG: NAD(P)H-hydrate epimerase [Planctomycetota bacterium]
MCIVLFLSQDGLSYRINRRLSIDAVAGDGIIREMSEWTGDNTSDFVVMTRRQVRDFDAWAINRMKIPGVVLMENAAKNCTDVILKHFPNETKEGVCIFCGTGNNGGDGFVIARHLYNHGVSVKVVLCADPARIKGDAKINFDICQNMNLPITMLDTESDDLCKDVEAVAAQSGLLVDAILGTGLQGQLKEPFALLISSINSHNLPIVAVDIPSGLDCDTGRPLPVSIEAAATIAFVALKKGFVANPDSHKATGRVFVADIGITPTA